MTQLVFANIATQAPMWSVMEMMRLRDELHWLQVERRRVYTDVLWASRDVQDAHDRFRRYYLGNGKTLNFCRCMAHVEPHLHAPRRLRRIGHLPMMTMKELPE